MVSKNRSVPSETILPHVDYQNLGDAIVWLTVTFGFQEHYRYGDGPSGGQMWAREGCRREYSGGAPRDGVRGISVPAEDLDGHHWLFSRHAKDVNPEDWGAVVSPNSRDNSKR